MLRPTKERAIERLQEALNAIPSLKSKNTDSQEFMVWRRDTAKAIGYVFGRSNQVKEFTSISWTSSVPRYRRSYYDRGIERASALLKSMIHEIEEYWGDQTRTSTTIEESMSPSPVATNQVFVVHGRDDGTREMVARFLQGLELEPIILQEQPNEGRTIIEKFEDYADTVGFSVAICTPDDVGTLATERHNLRPRMRQNVVLELGYFAGKIGRKRVCALVKGDIETPSDYDGVIYIMLDDAEGWKLQLARELRAAELPVNMDGLL